MRPGALTSRGFIFGMSILVLLTAAAVGFFVYQRVTASSTYTWSYIERADGSLYFGKAKLLEGGFVELTDVHVLVRPSLDEEASLSDQFRLETITPEVFAVSPIHIERDIRLGPNEVRQWGDVPMNSEIWLQLERVHKAYPQDE